MDSHSTSGKEAETARGSAFLVDIQPASDSELARPDCFVYIPGQSISTSRTVCNLSTMFIVATVVTCLLLLCCAVAGVIGEGTRNRYGDIEHV